jgi:hypothetical protein
MPLVTNIDRTFAAALLRFDLGPALLAGDDVVDHGELRRLVRDRADQLDLPCRSVVLLSGSRSIEYVVTYLALLDAGHVPLLAGDTVAPMIDAWSPAAVIRVEGDHVDIDRRVRTSGVELHPELALLLSTSGSTGSPKLVRLSHRNLTSNAEAIAQFLDLTTNDRAITSLPLHYCYGLSVLHSHLIVGAGVVLTDASVVDPSFRADVERHGVTNVAGVPHTFELLENGGWDVLATPSLRFLTQAGGRLAPASVRRWARRADARGIGFSVMYGQTEATARMAHLPNELAARRPECVGRAIPGGSLTLRPIDGVGVEPGPGAIGELVYRGPNVMLGYAERTTDLASGATIDELATGDLARFHPDDGVFEIVGRRSRFVKPFGLRIDLDQLEHALGNATGPGGEVAVAGDDERLLVLAPGADADAMVDRVVACTGLPSRWIHVTTSGEVPRTPAGKVDHPAVARVVETAARAHRCAGTDDSAASVAGVFAAVLGTVDLHPDDTFVSLGGDSLRYVDCSVRLERLLESVPPDWHLRAIGDLEARARVDRSALRWWRAGRLDTTVALRAVAICLVVATHMGLWYFPGGAHLMLAVVGYNLSRFLLPVQSTRDRLVAAARTAGRAAVPAIVWMSVGMVVFGAYSTGSLFLVNNYAGPASHADDHWHFWFIEVMVHIVALTAIVFSFPPLRRADRRHPYFVPLVALGCLLLFRLDWADLGDWYNLRYRTHAVAWFAALGWLVHRSDTRVRRIATSVICIAVVPGFFENSTREWFIVIAMVVLVWVRVVRAPRLLIRPIGVVASASLWIYISHFTLWPPAVDAVGVGPGYLVTIGGGVGIWAAARIVRPALRPATARLVEQRRRARTEPHRRSIRLGYPPNRSG